MAPSGSIPRPAKQAGGSQALTQAGCARTRTAGGWEGPGHKGPVTAHLCTAEVRQRDTGEPAGGLEGGAAPT